MSAPYVWPRLPPAGDGQAVGLLGGSFNPPHAGHLHVSRLALRRFGLDQIWWLVTPGNPLKGHGELQPLEHRLAACRRLTAGEPSIRATAVEAEIGTRRTRDTLRYLKARRPDLRFVWLMGADNMAGFHRWHAWREIAETVPIGVIDRPHSTFSAVAGPFARRFAARRLDEAQARLLPSRKAPAWALVHGPRSALSSTAIRNSETWP